MTTSLETLAKHPKIFQEQSIQDEISKMAASLETLARLPRLRSGAWIRTNKQNNERLRTLAKRPKISTKTFDDVPDEVLLKICGYLSIKNIVRCSGVSKRVRRVCHDKPLWEKTNLCGKEVPSEFIEQILANGCTYLNLHGAQIKGTLILPQKNYQLKYLNLEKLKANMKSVQKLLACSFFLEKTSLSGLKLNKKLLNSIKNENLKVLDLSWCSGVSGLTIESFNKVIKCDELTELNLGFFEGLYNSKMGSKSSELVDQLVNNLPPNLEKLCLGGFDCLSDDHVKVIANRSKKLTEFDLFGACRITNRSIAYIIENLPELVTLDISFTKIGINAIIELKSLSNLKILNCQHLSCHAQCSHRGGHLLYHVTNDQIKSLKRQLPNLTIYPTSYQHQKIHVATPNASIKEEDGFWDITVQQINLFSCGQEKLRDKLFDEA